MTSLLVSLAASSSAGAMGGFGWASAPEVEVISKCPPRKTYTEDFLKRAGGEVKGLLKADPQSPVANMLNDYRRLRRGCDGIEKR